MARKRSRWTTGAFGRRSQEVQVVPRREKATINPSQLFVFVDETEDSIYDGHLLLWPNPDIRWLNLPSGGYRQSGVFSFAEGLLEQWKWQAPKKFSPKQGYWKMVESQKDLCDLQRLEAATLADGTFIPQHGDSSKP